MSLFDNHLGIQVCKDRVRLVEIAYKEEEFYLENVGEQDFDNEIENFDELTGILQKSYQKASSERSLDSKFVSFTFAPSFFKVFEVPFDNTLLKDDLKNQLNWELKKLYPSEADTEYLIQNMEYKSGLLNRENYTGVVALPKTLVAGVVKFSKNNDLSVKYIDHPQTAANVFLKLLINDFKNKLGLSIYIGSRTVSAMLVSDGIPLYIKQLKYTNDDEIDSKLKSILEELVYYDLNLTNIGFAYISGDAITDELVTNLIDQFGIKIKIINPFEKIKISPNFKPPKGYRERASSFAAPAGLALRLI